MLEFGVRSLGFALGSSRQTLIKEKSAERNLARFAEKATPGGTINEKSS
jgi:hypothetical protein